MYINSQSTSSLVPYPALRCVLEWTASFLIYSKVFVTEEHWVKSKQLKVNITLISLSWFWQDNFLRKVDVWWINVSLIDNVSFILFLLSYHVDSKWSQMKSQMYVDNFFTLVDGCFNYVNFTCFSYTTNNLLFFSEIHVLRLCNHFKGDLCRSRAIF